MGHHRHPSRDRSPKSRPHLPKKNQRRSTGNWADGARRKQGQLPSNDKYDIRALGAAGKGKDPYTVNTEKEYA